MGNIDQDIKTKFQNDKHRFITNVIYTSNWVQAIAGDFLKPYGISSQQFNILRILRGAKDWVAMNTIKDLMIEKAPNATRLSDKLLNKDLINRKRCDTDRRVVFLEISDKGLALLKAVDEETNGEHMKFLDNITDEEAKMISTILDRMRG